MKIAYGWVVNWGDLTGRPSLVKAPRVTVDLFFSSREKFLSLLCTSDKEKEILVPINVPDDFDDWDYIPDNY